MRRNSTEDGRRGSQDPATLLNNKNVGDLIYRYETKNDAHIREILSSPQLQHQLDMLYYKNTITPDMRLNDLARIRYIQQQQLQQQQYRNESLLSLTDSEFYSDDQYQDSSYDRSSANEKVAHNLTRFGKFIEMIARLPWPRMSVTGMGICFLLAVFICPRAFGEKMLFPAFRLLFGTLYPAYASYKAVRTKNVKEYVKWMMYWIVYAFFTCIETFTDIFLAWFPFYYEVKVIIVIWLLSPATKGSSTLYRKFVHPMLTRREQEIDEYINQAKDKGYTAVLQLGSKGVNYATNVIMQTALKTFQVPPGQGTIHSSRSDYGISSSSYAASHGTDTADSAMIRTQSVDSALSLKHQFDGSSEDEDVFLANNDANSNSTPVENSSARIREPPKRKTRSNVTHGITISKKSSKIAIRGRRKLKETIVEPDEMEVVDIE